MHSIHSLTRLHIGATLDVACRGSLLVAVQSGAYPCMHPGHNGRLIIMDTATPAHPVILGTLDGIGSARQVELCGDTAYVTAREDGLYAIDISDPRHPALLCHYDTAEYATGLAIANDLLVTSLRQYGLELIDARDPRRLRHIGLVRTGEAQSLCMDGHHVYAGVWGSQELVIADIAMPQSPRIVARAPLDGRGDGVAVHDGICYAATGQHGRRPVGVQNPDPACYERRGNGLELFDVRDPAHPVRLGGVKFPPYYGLTFDMWDVQISGDTALVSNTRNGLYAVDVSDPRSPSLLGSIRLPRMPDGTHEPITGFAFEGEALYLAGGDVDAYACRYSPPLAPAAPASVTARPVDGRTPFTLDTLSGSPLPYRRALPGRNVRFATLHEDRLYAACSESGVAVLNPYTLQETAHIRTGGFAHTVQCHGQYVYVAACHAGLRIFQRQGDTYSPVAQFGLHGRSVMDVLLSGDGQYALLQIASLGIALLDISRPEAPHLHGSALSFVGLFYGRHFPSRADGHRFHIGVNRDGCFAVDPATDGLRLSPVAGLEGGYVGPGSGIELLADGTVLHLSAQGCTLAGGMHLPIEGPIPVSGKPRLMDGLLVTTERATGHIFLADATDLTHMRTTNTLHTSGSPDLASIGPCHIYIPLGHQGLLVLEKPTAV